MIRPTRGRGMSMKPVRSSGHMEAPFERVCKADARLLNLWQKTRSSLTCQPGCLQSITTDPSYLFTMLAFIALPGVSPSVRPFVQMAPIARACRTSGLCRSHDQPKLAPIVYPLKFIWTSWCITAQRTQRRTLHQLGCSVIDQQP